MTGAVTVRRLFSASNSTYSTSKLVPVTLHRPTSSLLAQQNIYNNSNDNGYNHVRTFSTVPPAKMRLPYIPDDPSMPNEADQAVVERVKARRGGKLIALDKTLLHSPPVADGWNSFLGAIRTKTSLADSVREIAICRVAALNQAFYEWDAHAPLLEKSGVLSPEAIQYVKDRPRPGQSTTAGQEGEDKGGELLDEKHLAVLQYTDAMTIGCVVPAELFKRLKGMFSDKEVVEITSTVAAYNCVSRFLVALDVGEMAAKYNVDMS